MAWPKGKPRPPGTGRPKGAVNKNTKELKDMILAALDNAGGIAYLQQQAIDNPGPFMSLIGKVLPMAVTGADGGPVVVEIVQFGSK